MKALSIKQPWASLIAHGIKDIENRTWKTKFRGRIYIHATAKEDIFFKGKNLAFTPPQWATIPKEFSFPENRNKIFIASAIIGEVDIVDCVINHPSVWAEQSLTKPNIEDYVNPTGGNMELFKHNVELWKNSKPIYNWVLANPVLYDKPILNVKGKLSFWEPDNDIVECIGCSQKFDSEFMEEDSAGEKYCKECEEVLFPIMKKEYDELVAKGEIEPEND